MKENQFIKLLVSEGVRKNRAKEIYKAVSESFSAAACSPESSENDENPTFEAFWKAYPARKGRKVGKKQAKEQWDKLNQDEKRACFLAVSPYFEYIQVDGRYAKDANRWIRDRNWLDFAPDQKFVESDPESPQAVIGASMGSIRAKIERDQRMKENRYGSPGTGVERRSIQDKRSRKE